MDFKIKVIPRSRKTEFAGVMDDGTLKVKVAAVPEDGKANKALCSFLASHHGVPQAKDCTGAGLTSTFRLAPYDNRGIVRGLPSQSLIADLQLPRSPLSEPFRYRPSVVW